MRQDVLIAIFAMAAAAFVCRVGGFFLMRYVTITPRVEAALKSIPMAVVVSVLAVAALKGGVPEWAGIATALGMMVATRSDLLSITAGIATVGVLRSFL